MTKNTLSLHLDILDKSRKDTLERLLFLSDKFVLGGGTAIALQLAHRLSFDFDFFTLSPLPKTLLEKNSKEIAIKNIAVDSPDELTFFTKDDIKLTFLHYPFKNTLSPLEAENGLQLFSLSDLAFQKAYTIGRRGEYRDYFDIYTLLQQNYLTLAEIILGAQQIYGSIFDEKLFLEQLVYFDDLLETSVIPLPGHAVPPVEEVKHSLEEAVKKYLE